MKRTALLVSLFIGLTFAVHSGTVDAWTTKKKWEEMVASWPAEGPKPTAEYAQAIAKAYFDSTLKDPYSAHYQWGPAPTLGTFKGAIDRFGTPGWIFDVFVNGKNSYGAYVGMTQYKIITRSGHIVGVYQYNVRMQGWTDLVGRAPPIPPPPQLAAFNNVPVEPSPAAPSVDEASAPPKNAEGCKTCGEMADRFRE